MTFEGPELERYKECFDSIDTDNNGCITHEELKIALYNLGYKPSDEQVQDLIDEADDDGDGTISLSEFIRVISGQPAPDKQKARLRRMFREFDIDSSGFITIDNLREILAESGVWIEQEMLEAMIAEGDTDCDGRISYEEFVVMVENGGGFPL